MTGLDISDPLWDEVHACILEIEWFATRKKNLEQFSNANLTTTWADMLMNDIEDLRRGLIRVQQKAKVENDLAWNDLKPIGHCNRCKRKIWKSVTIGCLDEMIQPDGGICGGRFVEDKPLDVWTKGKLCCILKCQNLCEPMSTTCAEHWR